MQDLEKILKDRFWLNSFRDWQREVIESVLAWENTLVFMPTWWWKSLTYQLPWVVLEWLVIVISPLISLMKDQVDKLNWLNIRAELINSTITPSEQNLILNELSLTNFKEKNPIKFLYIAPERLNSQAFLNAIKDVKISLIAIDEAHCISQRWHDFRPSYMKIKWFLEGLKKEKITFPIIALTATATNKVRKDIIERLWFKKFNSFIKGFDRKNIIIIVREISKKEDKQEKLLEIINSTPWSGIVYCSSRKSVWEVYDFLQEKNISAWIYTWEMNSDSREQMQNNFMNSNLKVIVATNAFGMWIDKSDIRFVIHYNLPWSIENYYQEVGRAWRDSKKSFWVVIASYWDTKIQEFFIENSYPSKQEILKFYDYLYSLNDDKDKSFVWKTILKTYTQMSRESWLENDLKAWSIIKVLEKYGILKRWADYSGDIEFRWRGITILLDKFIHSKIPIDWSHQENLKNEAYYKLDQIKKLLFYPSCRKRFILEYFWDEEDLSTLWENCNSCDYCIEKKKVSLWKWEKILPLSVFWIVLDVVNKFDKKFWIKVISGFLCWSREKKILEWWLDKFKHYSSLSEYKQEIIIWVIDSLIKYDFIEKTTWNYPVIGLTRKGQVSLNRENILKEFEDELQSFLAIKFKSQIFKNNKDKSVKSVALDKKDTFLETKKLLDLWKSILEISKTRALSPQTIESHILRLYESSDIPLTKLLDFVNFDYLKEVRSCIIGIFSLDSVKLKEIKEDLENSWKNYIDYFHIKTCISMMNKWDF